MSGLDTTDGIALDIAGGKMYWTAGKIQRANLDGSGVEDLVPWTSDLGLRRCIALDTAGGKMYWTESRGYLSDSGGSAIKRANLDGSGVEELVYVEEGFLEGYALDVAGGKMYGQAAQPTPF